jgi:carboxyl-terminal processing protease
MALIAGAVQACAAATTASPPSDGIRSEPIRPDLAVATFDSVWTVVQQTYVDTAFIAAKWNAVRDSLRPQAMAVMTRAGLARILASTLAAIPDSHFYIIPESVASNAKSGDEAGDGTTGLSVRLAGGGAIVWQVAPGSPADNAGIRPGMLVEAVNKQVVASLLQKVTTVTGPSRQRAFSELDFKLNRPLSPAVGKSVVVKVQMSGNDSPRDVTLVAVPKQGTISKFGNLPPIAGVVRVERKALPSTSTSAKNRCAGVIALNIWLPALVPELERGVESVANCAGIVIDLRGNPGGVGAMVMGFGGFFVATPASLGTMRTRELSLNFAINPRRIHVNGMESGPFNGPVAILVDAMTASTSEIFASGMQRLGRARIFGERSAGAALPALMLGLPSGDIFVHAIADFRDPTGARIEGAGVTPDEVVPLTQSDLARNIDAPLDHAITWIASGNH